MAKRFFICFCAATLMMLPAVHAQDVPDLSACKALQDKEAYTKRYDDYAYMVQGREGWLFRTEQDMRTDFSLSEDALLLFSRFSDALKKKGTELVIAIAPTRAMTASDFLLASGNPFMASYDPAKARKNYADFLVALNGAGIHAAGTPEIKSGGDYFYKTDQHWTPSGAREMAQATAGLIKTLPVYRSLKKTEFTTAPELEGTFEGHFNEPVKALCHVEMPPEKTTQYRTVPRHQKADQESLFGAEGEPEIVLVGTSNSNREELDMNFAGSLKEFLSADIYNAAMPGGGMDDALLAYLSSDRFRKSPAKILIWELPGYYDLNGDDAAKTLQQAIPAVLGPCATPLADSGPVALTSGEVTLLDGLEAKPIKTGEFYLHLTLDKPARKKFTVVLNKADGSEKKVRFTSSRNPDNRSFFYAPGGKKGVLLRSVTLQGTEEIKGFQADTKLCRMSE